MCTWWTNKYNVCTICSLTCVYSMANVRNIGDGTNTTNTLHIIQFTRHCVSKTSINWWYIFVSCKNSTHIRQSSCRFEQQKLNFARVHKNTWTWTVQFFFMIFTNILDWMNFWKTYLSFLVISTNEMYVVHVCQLVFHNILGISLYHIVSSFGKYPAIRLTADICKNYVKKVCKNVRFCSNIRKSWWLHE